jgi:hypothetical protein
MERRMRLREDVSENQRKEEEEVVVLLVVS